MASVTYYVALPFVSTEDGEFVASEAQECQTATAAIRRAQSLASSHAGAIAFARTGDPATGDFDYAEVLQRFGQVPSDDVLMGYD
jgi:hypothetical protein